MVFSYSAALPCIGLDAAVSSHRSGLEHDYRAAYHTYSPPLYVSSERYSSLMHASLLLYVVHTLYSPDRGPALWSQAGRPYLAPAVVAQLTLRSAPGDQQKTGQREPPQRIHIPVKYEYMCLHKT